MGRVKAMSVPLASVWLLAVGCGAGPVRMLHERPAFDGKITVESDTLSLTGELVFDRESRNCQLTRRRPTTVVLGRDRDGNLFVFEDGKPRSMQGEEEHHLRVVLALVDGKGITAIRPHEDGYSLQLAHHGRLRVTLEERAPGPHERRR